MAFKAKKQLTLKATTKQLILMPQKQATKLTANGGIDFPSKYPK